MEKPDRINRSAINWLDQYSPYGVITTDTRLVITGWNQWMAFAKKMEPESILGKGLLKIFPDLVARNMDRYFRAALLGQTAMLSHKFHDYLIAMEPDSGRDEFTHMPQSATISPLSQKEEIIGTITYIENVSERIQRERELENRIAELEAAAKQIKTLRELIPICSYCKKIRDDKGYWNSLETYIEQHANMDFSHGICPECAKKHYPEYDLYGEDDE